MKQKILRRRHPKYKWQRATAMRVSRALHGKSYRYAFIHRDFRCLSHVILAVSKTKTFMAAGTV